MKKCYAVKAGYQTGIFQTWAECEAQIKGFSGAKFKGFGSQEEAEAWLNGTPMQKAAPASVKAPRQRKPAAPSVRKQTAAPRKPLETSSEDMDYIIYTDGSCLRNPDGPGGWAAVIMDSCTGQTEELHGGNPSTTNNRMELSAAIAALSHISGNRRVLLYTDSKYLRNAIMKKWIANWKRNGWITTKGTDVLNKDLWFQLDALCEQHEVHFSWVKGHAGNTFNERCDQLAREEAIGCSNG